MRGQYKNCKNVLNLCKHKHDFGGIEAEWHFFATSHGKGPCDGVGGCVKRLITLASLRQLWSSHILCSQTVKWDSCLIFQHFSNEDYQQTDKWLKESRDGYIETIEGT